MSFKNFITEQANSNMAKIIAQRLMDNIDNVHVFKSDNSMKFNVGNTVGSNQLSNLDVVVANGDLVSVKLGKSKTSNDEYAIVITTPDMPERGAVDKFISTSSEVYDGIVNELTRFIQNKQFVHTAEEPKKDNTPSDFESVYDDIVSTINDDMDKLSNAIADMEKELETTRNMSRSAALKSAISQLKNETIGQDAEEFVGIVMKKNKKLVSNLDKSDKSKMEKRLKSYYKSTTNKFN